MFGFASWFSLVLLKWKPNPPVWLCGRSLIGRWVSSWNAGGRMHHQSRELSGATCLQVDVGLQCWSICGFNGRSSAGVPSHLVAWLVAGTGTAMVVGLLPKHQQDSAGSCWLPLTSSEHGMSCHRWWMKMLVTKPVLCSRQAPRGIRTSQGDVSS